MVINKEVLFTKVPDAFPVPGEHMKVVDTQFNLEQELKDGQIILKLLYLSVDPYMRGRMRDASVKSYAPAFDLNKPMNGDTMNVVVRSNNPNYKEGDLVYGRTAMGYFKEYILVDGDYAKAAYVVRNDPKTNHLPLSHYVGVLGMPGMTAYYGLTHVGKPVKGETIYVSAASGAVGQLVGQFAKAMGLYVVGSAGSSEKIEYLKEIGFDAVFNYKEGDIKENLKTHCPKGIDIYYESVGGASLDAVLLNMNNFGRIIACGMISQYNKSQPDPIYNTMKIVERRLTIQGFIIMDHMDYETKFLKDVTQLIVDKKIKYREDILEGIENTPQQLVNVLKGKNFGKAIVHVADP